MTKLLCATALGVVLGIGATQMLNAQAKPPAFLVTELGITDQAKYAAWRDRINPTFAKYGGKFLARNAQGHAVIGSALTELPKSATLIQFESLDKFNAWNTSDEVKAARAIDRGATFRSYVVEGMQ